MSHTKEPAALMHANWLEKSLMLGAREVAEELRRLHEVEKQRDRLLAALESMAAKYIQPHKEYFGDEIAQDISRVKGGYSFAAVEQPAPKPDADGWIEPVERQRWETVPSND